MSIRIRQVGTFTSKQERKQAFTVVKMEEKSMRGRDFKFST